MLVLLVFVLPKIVFRNFPGPAPDSYLYGNVKYVPKGGFPAWLLARQREYGEVFQVWLLQTRVIVLSNADDVRFVTAEMNFPKSDGFVSGLSPFLGDGLLLIDNNRHKAQRRAIAARFNQDFMKDLHLHIEATMASFVQILDRAADEGSVLDFDAEITKFTLNVICRSAFGSNTDFLNREDELPSLVDAALRHSAKYLVHARYTWWLGKLAAPALFETAHKVHEFVLDMIRARRSESELARDERPVDLLDIFLSVPGMDNNYVASEVSTFLFAGHDTTSHTLAWLMYEVVQRQDIMHQIQKEVCETVVLKEGENGFPWPSFDQVRQLDYLNMVWKETLRKRPVTATGTYRVITDDVELPGTKTKLRKGTEVLIPPYLIHQNERYWYKPEAFDPLRWTRENSLGRHPYALQAFSSGPRNCIGQIFATHEALVVLAVLFARYDFKLACPPEDIMEFHSLTMRPRLRRQSKLQQHKGAQTYLPVRVFRKSSKA
ncbi:Cytochrome P450 4B1 [Porphyridium purpureum]|uniref:Cytochrome P450 4B1 n=1 Tax=Porphyridium purpureum TaxID=35688 RepID=A0A5J4YV19_PORPP|nr:Cytochrome P450 4B1 [Porphyridium purpureum]|eukprot:POR4554..scf227_4